MSAKVVCVLSMSASGGAPVVAGDTDVSHELRLFVGLAALLLALLAAIVILWRAQRSVLTRIYTCPGDFEITADAVAAAVNRITVGVASEVASSRVYAGAHGAGPASLDPPGRRAPAGRGAGAPAAPGLPATPAGRARGDGGGAAGTAHVAARHAATAATPLGATPAGRTGGRRGGGADDDGAAGGAGGALAMSQLLTADDRPTPMRFNLPSAAAAGGGGTRGASDSVGAPSRDSAGGAGGGDSFDSVASPDAAARQRRRSATGVLSELAAFVELQRQQARQQEREDGFVGISPGGDAVADEGAAADEAAASGIGAPVVAGEPRASSPGAPAAGWVRSEAPPLTEPLVPPLGVHLVSVPLVTTPGCDPAAAAVGAAEGCVETDRNAGLGGAGALRRRQPAPHGIT